MSATSNTKYLFTCTHLHKPPVDAEPHSDEITNGISISHYDFECGDCAPKEYERQRNKIQEHQTAMKAKWQKVLDGNRESIENEFSEGPAKIEKLRKCDSVFHDCLEEQQKEEDEELEALWDVYERRWGVDFLERP